MRRLTDPEMLGAAAEQLAELCAGFSGMMCFSEPSQTQKRNDYNLNADIASAQIQTCSSANKAGVCMGLQLRITQRFR